MCETIYILLIFINIFTFSTCEVFPKTLEVITGGSFVEFLDNEPGADLEKCFFNFTENQQINLYPRDLENLDDPIKNRLSGFKKRYCGFKLKNISSRDPLKFDLFGVYIFANKTLLTKRKTTIVKLTENKKIVNEPIVVAIGEENKRIKCSENLSQSDHAFCSIYYPSGILAEHSRICMHQIRVVKKEHIGKWKCKISTKLNMNPEQINVDVILKKFPKIKTWYREQDGFGIVGCQYLNKVPPALDMSECEFILPDNQSFSITANTFTERYTGLGTNFKNEICQVDFKLPPLDNEKGTWKCNLNDLTGYINVKKVNPYKKYEERFVEQGKSEKLTFEVPYEASGCFITSPKGDIVYRGGLRELASGRCIYIVQEIQEQDLGIWNCHFSKAGSLSDEVVSIKLKEENHLKPLETDVKISEGGNMEVIFVSNDPISTCAFQDPHGRTYHLTPKSNSWMLKDEEDVEYKGKGFASGECGIRIKNVTKDMTGNWTCLITNSVSGFTMVVRQGQTFVSVDPPQNDRGTSLALPVGLGTLAGVVIFALAVGFLYVRKNYQRIGGRKERVSPAESTDSMTEGNIPLRNISSLMRTN